MNKKRDYVISEIIYDRDFDIPDWIYEHVNENVIEQLIRSINNNIVHNVIVRYSMEPNVKRFFDTIHDRLHFSNSFIKKIIENKDYEYALLLFGKRENYIYSKNHLINSHSKVSRLYDTIRYGLDYDGFIGRIGDLIKISSINKEEIIRICKVKILSECTDFDGRIDTHLYQSRINRLVKSMNVSNSMDLSDKCIDLGIPVFYKYGDQVNLFNYLTCVKEYNWRENLDNNIFNISIDNPSNEFIELVLYISNNINSNALKILRKIITDDTEYLNYAYDSFNKKYIDRIEIQNFKDIIEIFGENKYGLPIEIQRKFIINGGDVKTMFDGDNLLDEANIIKISYEIGFIIKTISVEDLRYLIYNSSDFVRNILNPKNLSHSNMIKILEAIFEYPLNKELWNVLNKTGTFKTSVDFRESIVSMIISYIGLDSMYKFVPSSMMYNTPGALYITRNIDKDIIKYIPVEKLVPYINNIISRQRYIPFNLYCKGEYISLTKVFKNTNILIQNIVTYKKFGYICDITEIDHNKLLDMVCKYI